MKRYLLFVGYFKYPSGGMDDFVGDFDSKDAALQAVLADEDLNGFFSLKEFKQEKFIQIYDSHLRKDVYKEIDLKISK